MKHYKNSQDEGTQNHYKEKMINPAMTERKKVAKGCPKGDGSTAHNSSEVLDALLMSTLDLKNIMERIQGHTP